MSGRYVRCEAGWPDGLAEKVIHLADLGQHPRNGGRWIAGKSETGATVVPGLTDKIPHFLVAGETGSGKSVALRSAVLQLSADPDNSIVLVDGKMGESLRAEVIVGLLRKLAAQGRAAHVHCLLATQHPTVDAFGDSSIRRNLVGKVALRVAEYEPENVGQDLPTAGWSYSGAELAVSIVSAAEGEGRPTLVRRLQSHGLGRPGAERGIRLLKLGREAYDWLQQHGYAVCLSGGTPSEATRQATAAVPACVSA